MSPEVSRARILEYFRILHLPLLEDDLDRLLRKAEETALSPLAFLECLLGEQARGRQERSIERRIKNAKFRDRSTLETFDWNFNKDHIPRPQMEELATADFVRRRDNLIFVGQSGIGKSHLIQALGIRACAAGYSVRYVTSASLIAQLTAALADRSLPIVLKSYTRPQLLIIDEFGLDKIERTECPQAANLLYKVVDARYHGGSTALATNIDFDAWASYIGDGPLSMAFLDRLVEAAIIIRFPTKTKSWRKAQAEKRKTAANCQAASISTPDSTPF